MMSEHMSAAQYRREFVDTAEEPENPYNDTYKKPSGKLRLKPASNPLGYPYPQATEHEIQSAILERLGLLSGAFFWRENSGLMQVGEPGKQRFFRAGTPGIPDIMGVYKGRSVGIEVKRPGKKQSIDQLAFMQRLRQCGGVYIVCTDSAKVVEQINQEIAKYEQNNR